MTADADEERFHERRSPNLVDDDAKTSRVSSTRVGGLLEQHPAARKESVPNYLTNDELAHAKACSIMSSTSTPSWVQEGLRRLRSPPRSRRPRPG